LHRRSRCSCGLIWWNARNSTKLAAKKRAILTRITALRAGTLCGMGDIVTLINWNLNAFTSDRLVEKLDVLRRLDWDVATLQELLPANIRTLEEAFPNGIVIAREPSRAWPRPAQRRCCCLVVRRSDRLIREQLIDCDDGVSESGTPNVPDEVL